MKIGIYFGDYLPESGGAYTFVSDMLESFTKLASTSEHSFVLMCTPAAVSGIRGSVNSPNVEVVPVPRIPRWARWFAGLKYYSPIYRRIWRKSGLVERTARGHGVQLLWYVGTGVYECPDIPYVATQWDLNHRIIPYFPELSARGIWDDREQFYAYFLRRASYCVTGTEVGKLQIVQAFQLADSRVRVVPMPTPKFALDSKPSTVDVRNRFGLDKEYVFFPAQFWPHKNHANLILALTWLKENRGLDIQLAFSGSDFGNLSYIKSFADKNGMGKQVFYLGFVTREELVALYQQSIALTFMSLCGPDNIPPLEAFALGVPVIASAVEGAHEQLGTAAIIVNSTNPAEIGQAIWDIHSNKELRANLVEAGLKRARAWTSDDYIKRMFGLFDEFSSIRRNWA